MPPGFLRLPRPGPVYRDERGCRVLHDVNRGPRLHVLISAESILIREDAARHSEIIPTWMVKTQV